MAVKSLLILVFIASFLFSCKSKEDRLKFIDAHYKKLALALKDVSLCAGGEKRDVLKIGVPTFIGDKSTLAQSKLLAAAYKAGFASAQLYVLDTNKIEPIKGQGGDKVTAIDIGPNSEKIFREPEYTQTKLALMQTFELAGETQDFDKKLRFVLYGNYDSFSNVLRYLRSSKDHVDIAKKVYGHLANYYRTEKKSIRPGLADMVRLMLQANYGVSLAKTILADARVPSSVKRQVATHIRLLKITSQKKFIRQAILNANVQLANEAALTCIDFKDKKCKAHYQKMLKRHCYLDYSHDELWLVDGYRRL